MKPMILIPVLAAALLAAAPAWSCIPVIEQVTEYVWLPGGPVSICLSPGAPSRAFLPGGVEVQAQLRFPVMLIGEEDPDLIPVEWWGAGPVALCETYAQGFERDDEGWITVLPDLQGGGWSEPGGPGDVYLWIPVCPNQELHLDDSVGFNSPDINGDLAVDLSDVPLFVADYFSLGTYEYRSDFNWDQTVNLTDVVVLTESLGSYCR